MSTAKFRKRADSEEDLIREFRSLPRSEALEQYRGKEPRSMDDLVAMALEEMKVGDMETSEGEIAGNWSRIVGRDLAGKCAPDRLTADGLLVIHASGAAVRQELSFRKRQILKVIQDLPLCSQVRDLSLRTT